MARGQEQRFTQVDKEEQGRRPQEGFTQEEGIFNYQFEQEEFTKENEEGKWLGKQKEYRQTSTFRVAGGLLDEAGYDLIRLRETEQELKKKRDALLEKTKPTGKKNVTNKRNRATEDISLRAGNSGMDIHVENGKAFVLGIETSKENRMKGEGTKLMNLLVEYLDKNHLECSLTAMKMEPDIDMKRLVQFYKRFGFVVVDDTDEDNVLMARFIK